MDKTKHHIQNTHNFIESIKNTKYSQEVHNIIWCIAFFIFVLVDKSLPIVCNKLVQDQGVPLRTKLPTQHITELLGFCLHSTYFLFQGKYYKQVEEVAMGSPVSPIKAKIYME